MQNCIYFLTICNPRESCGNFHQILCTCMGGGKVRKRPSNEDHQNDTCELLTPPEKSIFTLLNILFVFFAKYNFWAKSRVFSHLGPVACIKHS